MPGARCTRGLVCKNLQRVRTRAYRFSGGNPAFPAQWFYGLLRALPGDEFLLSPSSANWRLCETRLGSQDLRRLDTSNGCQDHTASPYATFAVRLARFLFAHGPKPALRSVHAPALPRPPHSVPNVRDDRDTSLLAGRNGGACSADLGFSRRTIFLREGLDGRNRVESVQEIRAKRLVTPSALLCHLPLSKPRSCRNGASSARENNVTRSLLPKKVPGWA
jgi:hypothetical protein